MLGFNTFDDFFVFLPFLIAKTGLQPRLREQVRRVLGDGSEVMFVW